MGPAAASQIGGRLAENSFPMFRTYKYRIRPTNSQEATLLSWLDLTRELYNAALQERNEAWRKQRKSISKYDQQAQPVSLRKDRPDIIVPIGAQRGVLGRAEKSFASFFRRCKAGEKPGFPRFKSKKRWDSIEFENKPASGLIKGKRIFIPKMGLVRISLHRSIEGTPATLKLKRINGKWYAMIGCDNVPEKPLAPTDREVGIDLGLLSFVATSDGEIFENPRPLKTARIHLERAQRRVSRRKKGSNRRRKAVALLAKRHARVANIRRENHIKVAGSLVSKYDTIYIEALNIKALSKSRLSKSIRDAAWSSFKNWLLCKAEEAGRVVIEVDPRYTSQTCSGCGRVEKKTLSTRVHECECGVVLDRDINAAINIKRLGSSLRREALVVDRPQRPEKLSGKAR